MPHVNGRIGNGLTGSGWPADDDAIDGPCLPQAVMQWTLVLRAEPRGRAHFLCLHMPIPVQLNARTDSAAIAARSLELELNPVAAWRHVVLVDQQRPALV